MILENEKCYIEIEVDKTYTIDSADNRHYDITMNPDLYRRSDLSKTLSIHIDLFFSDYRIALIGSYFSSISNCAILDGDILTILQDKMITQIRIMDAAIVRNRSIDCFGCTSGIYKIKQGYIIHGEIEIIMLDFDLNKKWSFSGKDVFVSTSNREPFILKEKAICLYDFDDNYYELDFDGKQIV